MKILLIIPAYNEAENIVKTVADITVSRPDIDYIVINDGSTDTTEQVCKENMIKCISLLRNLGIGGAVQTGYIYALKHDYDVAVQFDGDGQHDIASLDSVVSPVVAGKCDLCVGSRFLDDTSNFRSTFMRRIGIRYLSNFIKVFTGMRINDVTSGYRAANRRVIRYFSENYPTQHPEAESLVLLKKSGFEIKEVPAQMRERKGGKSSISSWRIIYFMFTVSLAIIFASFAAGKVNR